ncbi:Variant surface glycoprotein [Trypanosoma congolense IL3000]|uniref:Variant surface glycoprotein n=1 Tax=Trypanosoma congolense (strain IL3000) TaxID=1068625 RepID=F9WHN5_TRYCI|nr:Variant surface glycoprotein [Trypanosoma congolense IL3000]
MCKKIKMVYRSFFGLSLVSCIFLEVGSGNGINGEVYDLLCNVTGSASALLKLNEGDGVVQSTLGDAVYGKGSRAQFSPTGTVSLSRRFGVSPTGRGPLCTYYRGTQARVMDGCFTESLFGVLMCVCTPGEGSSGNLCGVEISKYKGGVWSSNFNRALPTDLLNEVWEKVIKNCTGSGAGQDIAQYVEDLKIAVNKVRNSLTSGKISHTDYFYLGEKDNESNCNGVNGKNICAAYQINGKKKENVNIPWADKIDIAVSKIKPKVSRPAVKATLAPAAAEHRVANPAGQAEEHVKPEPQAGPAPNETDEKAENGKLLTETARSPGISNVPTKSKLKRSPKTKPLNEIPHVATNIDEDGFSLTKPLWLSMAALLN